MRRMSPLLRFQASAGRSITEDRNEGCRREATGLHRWLAVTFDDYGHFLSSSAAATVAFNYASIASGVIGAANVSSKTDRPPANARNNSEP